MDSRTDSFSGDFSTDATSLAPYGAVDAFKENFAAGHDYGQDLVHDPREHQHSQPLNDTQFPSQPQAPATAAQRRPKSPSATDQASARHNAMRDTALSSATWPGYGDE